MSAILEQYYISDFLEWYKEKKLILSPHFQRGNVWKSEARSYLINTILRQLPMPKIYLRTKIDIKTKRSFREVIDGQQRLRAIIEFADDKFSLGKRAEEFEGLKYSTLTDEQQEIFIRYPIAVGQLLNANDDDVLELFSRLNSYTVTLNEPEKRHAKFQGEFKWAIRYASLKWTLLWDKYKIVPVKKRVRMLDDSLMAELFGVILEGVTDGGQKNITKLYDKYDESFDQNSEVINQVNNVLKFIILNIADDFINSPVLRANHFVMLFAAVAHAMYGIPEGGMGAEMPERNNSALTDLDIVRDNLLTIASVIGTDDIDNLTSKKDKIFWEKSKSWTQNIKSRKVRFPVFYEALIP